MEEDNKALVRRYVDEFQSAGKEETADADTTGREGAKQFLNMLRAAFPDLHAVCTISLAKATRS